MNKTSLQLVIFTTFILNDKTSQNKTLIQIFIYNSLFSISKKNKLIKIIIYVENCSYWFLKTSNNIIIKNIPKYNLYKTPYFGALMEDSIRNYKSNYYMYINGDIIITPHIFDIVLLLNKYKQKGILNRKLLCVATRSTFRYSLNFIYKRNNHYQLYMKGIKSATYSQDVFLMNEIAYKSHLKVYTNLLIGRAGIDNIILGCAINDTSFDVIDATTAIAAIHLEDCIYCKKKFISVYIYLLSIEIKRL